MASQKKFVPETANRLRTKRSNWRRPRTALNIMRRRPNARRACRHSKKVDNEEDTMTLVLNEIESLVSLTPEMSHNAMTSSSSNGSRSGSILSANNKRKSDMFVELDRPDGVYTAGEIIHGRVNIVLTQEIRVIDLILRFYGSGHVSWDEQRTYTKGSAPSVCHKTTEVYLDFSTSVLKKDSASLNPTVATLSGSNTLLTNVIESTEQSMVLAADNHSIPFQYQLPHDLPSTYSGKWGHVKYVIKAKLQRPWKFDIDRETDFTVKALVDLNEEPELARPIGALNEFNPGFMCIRSGPITVELRTARRGYVPGESIQISAEIENNSRYKLFHSHLTLNQHVLFRVGRKLRKTCAIVASLDKGDVLPGTNSLWNNEQLVVPVVAPTSHKSHRSIEIKYTLALSARYSSWSDQICVPVTLSIGTVPLRKQTINTYLTMLGYAHTPCSSPCQGRREKASPSSSILLTGSVASGLADAAPPTVSGLVAVSSTPRHSLKAADLVQSRRRSSNTSLPH